MTTVAVLADPPREGLVFSTLAGETSMSHSDATELYVACLKDVVRAIEASNGELLVNYRPDELLPIEFPGVESVESEVRSVVTEVLDDPDVRFERQVGSTRSARVGNTVTHLLDREGVASAAVVDPTVPLLSRTHVDSAAMQLRRHETVLGPAEEGRIYYAGFTAPIDFEDSYRAPELETLVERSRDADHDVTFLPALPTLDTPGGLCSVVSQIRARRAADSTVPEHTAAWIEDRDVRVVESDGNRRVRLAREGAFD